jgi:hypothetical protein
MSCKRPYEQEFMTRNLNSSWVKGAFRDHRKALLVEREIAQIPQTMPFVERYNQLATLRERQTEYKEQIERLRQTLQDTIAEKDAVTEMIRDIEAGRAGPAERKEFVMPCCYDGCNGFLSTQYKCGVCSRYTCSRCLCGIGTEKTNPDHRCNADDVASAEIVRKESKPCPTCGARVSRVSGCAQMWCPGCKQAWNWNTGRIDTGYIHNPHFQEWERGGGVRMPGDAVCGGPPPTRLFRELSNFRLARGYSLRALARTPYACDPSWFPDMGPMDKVEDFVTKYPALGLVQSLMKVFGHAKQQLQNLHHITGLVLPDARTAVRTAQNNEILRAKFIMKQISKEKFAAEIVKRDAARKKQQDLLHVWELLATVATELFLDTTEAVAAGLREDGRHANLEGYTLALSRAGEHMNGLQKRLSSLVAYCNHRFGIVSATYSLTAPRLDCAFIIEKQKQTSKFFATEPPSLTS